MTMSKFRQVDGSKSVSKDPPFERRENYEVGWEKEVIPDDYGVMGPSQHLTETHYLAPD
jgi:hypothetical protein